MAYQAAVGMWGIQPSEFWAMHPVEFWWLAETKRMPKDYGGGMSEAEVERIYEETYGSGDST